MTTPTVDRRRLLQTAAWSAPVVTVAAAAPTLAASPTVRTVQGTLTWGVKRSFRNYIVGFIAQGSVTASAGASQLANNGPLVFSGGKGTVDAAGTIRVQYAGTVRFYGHSGELDVTLSNPLLEVGADGTGQISVTHTIPGEDPVVRVLALIRSVTVSDGGTIINANNGDVAATVDPDPAPSVLAETGIPVFSGEVYGNWVQFYQAGDPMDAFSTALAVA